MCKIETVTVRSICYYITNGVKDDGNKFGVKDDGLKCIYNIICFFHMNNNVLHF